MASFIQTIDVFICLFVYYEPSIRDFKFSDTDKDLRGDFLKVLKEINERLKDLEDKETKAKDPTQHLLRDNCFYKLEFLELLANNLTYKPKESIEAKKVFKDAIKIFFNQSINSDVYN